MKKLILIAGILVVGLLAGLIFATREPVYNGKPLTAWLEQYQTNHFLPGTPNDLDKQADATLQHIGTNALPIYLQ